VDVNWNYDKDWYVPRNKNARGSIGFNGDYPNSEPETAAVAEYVDKYPFEAFLFFHTQGQIFYWADSKTHSLYIHEAIKNDTGFTGERDGGTGVGGSFFD
jgi:g-D-glutamyl-meso-diaminopimelate peptidase